MHDISDVDAARRVPAMQGALMELVRGLNPDQREIKEEWTRDPVLWMIERMKIPERTLRWSLNPNYDQHRWDGTPDPFVAISDALGNEKWVGVESATGTGKTFFAALTALWWIDCFEQGQVVTIAPKGDQLKLHLWKEVRKMWSRFRKFNPPARLLRLELRMHPGSDWGIVGFPVGVGGAEESATRAQGFHAENLLFITEETPGIHAAVMKAITHTLVGGPRNQWLALGNPDHQMDQLHLYCEKTTVTHIRISGYDHPNVVANDHKIVPGAVTQKSIDDRSSDFDSEDDPLFKSRTRGICPSETEHGLFKKAWIRAAQRMAEEVRLELIESGPPAYGVDVANSENGDYASLAKGTGALLTEVDDFPCPDSNILGSKVVTWARADEVHPINIGVDPIGVGAGTVNEMARLQYRPESLHGSAKPHPHDGEELFGNLRAQMYWALRTDLRNCEFGIDFDDEDLWREMLAIRFLESRGKIYIEGKKELSKRIGGSPNKTDSIVYWNWVRVRRIAPLFIGRA